MSANELIRALKAKRVGNNWMALCPAHEDRSPSLSISVAHDGKTLVHCFAGCAQGDVITELRRAGLWGADERVEPQPPQPPGAGTRQSEIERKPHVGALSIWRESQSV